MKLETGDTFAVIRGKYLGKFILFIEEERGFNKFLMMPGTFKVLLLKNKDFEPKVTWEKVDNIFGENYFNYVERVPENVRDVMVVQFKETIKEDTNIISDIFALK